MVESDFDQVYEKYHKYTQRHVIIIILFILSWFIPFMGVYNYFRYRHSFNSDDYHFARCSLLVSIVNLMIIGLIFAILFCIFYLPSQYEHEYYEL
jgi:uncharacterized membrane protein YidH (DUF202 family)